ncbi:hypothetical protein [Sulfobacillus sp. hq2]|uniref:hypothetical protein n=1 Tax=Sulfobacillus TaxID=28033 RepID=UPI0026AA0597
MESLKKSVSFLRMAGGSVLGIAGFGTISTGILPFRGEHVLLGLGEVAVGTVLALGVLTPLRTGHHPS